jgi:hypothetical protein
MAAAAGSDKDAGGPGRGDANNLSTLSGASDGGGGGGEHEDTNRSFVPAPARLVRAARDTAARNVVRHLASANFGEYSNVLWQLLQSRWKEEAVVSAAEATAAAAAAGGGGATRHEPGAASGGGEDKLMMVVAITMMVFVSNYSSGTFVALTPTFAEDFWGSANGTAGTDDGGDGIEPVVVGQPFFGFVEGIGILQTGGQVVRAVLGLISGLIGAAGAPGPGLKQRLTAMVLLSTLLNLGTVFGMMFATGYWEYFVWCVCAQCVSVVRLRAVGE